MENLEQVSIETEVQIPIESSHGEVNATFVSFSGLSEPHFAIRLGTIDKDRVPLVRVHSECVTGDIFGSLRCDCGPQLQEAIDRISQEGGYIIYLRQEGRGIGLNSKLKAYREQDKGLDTFTANRVLGFPDDARDFKLPAVLLKALGVQQIRLLSNNPDKLKSLVDAGIDVVESIPTGTFVNPKNRKYLEAKQTQKSHQLSITSEN